MFITLEGPDGSGKTTLADVLESALSPVDRLHHGVPIKHPLEELELPIQSYWAGGPRNLLTDRWYWSQYIYGPIYRNFNDYPGALATHRHIELFLRSRGNFTALLLPPPEVCLERAQARGEAGSEPKDRGFLEHLRAVHAGYRSVFAETSLESVRIDSTDVDREALAALIVRGAAEAEGRVIHLRDFPSYIGPPSPTVLLVTDRPSPGRSAHEHVAPLPPYPDTAGRYLLSALRDPWWRACGLVGTETAGGASVRLGVLWSSLRCPAVVALGPAASAMLDVYSIPHGAVPHPHYWRRFHHWRPELYADLIEAAARDGARMFDWPPNDPIKEEVEA